MGSTARRTRALGETATRDRYRDTAAARRRLLGPAFPASTGVLSPALPHPEALVSGTTCVPWFESLSAHGSLALDADGTVTALAAYTGSPEVSCYSRAEARRLNDTIRQSQTIHGEVMPRWNTAVICAFVEDTNAVC